MCGVCVWCVCVCVCVCVCAHVCVHKPTVINETAREFDAMLVCFSDENDKDEEESYTQY